MDVKLLYTENIDSYITFSNSFRYVQGLRSFFLSSGLLVPGGMKVMDAGCGTGFLSEAFILALNKKRLDYKYIQAFDVTPAMLDRFRKLIDRKQLKNIELFEADVLNLNNQLPGSWNNYDLVMSASMLEYIPVHKINLVLESLYNRLSAKGKLLFFVSRKNFVMKGLIAKRWNANLYSPEELETILKTAGASEVKFYQFPISHWWLNTWGLIVSVELSN